MDEIKQILLEAIDKLINHSASDKKITTIKNKHKDKIHFIPYNYRILGGILQSMNIQFGNFLEVIITDIVEIDTNNKIEEKYSGVKSNKFRISVSSERAIDDYITNCQSIPFSEETLKQNFDRLKTDIIKFEQSDNDLIEIKHDIDLLFRNKKTDQIIYAEIKYNDDHDTGKFVDINRKLLKTYAYLIREFKCTDANKIKPILMFFNKKIMKGNIYLPESENVYRGNRFFNEFTNIQYEDLDNAFKEISQSKEIMDKFNGLYKKVMEFKT